MEHNQNIHAARALLQRALRYCNQSHKLWSQYFDLELWSAVRALERQRILGLEVDTAVLSGAPAVVFKHAIRNVPDVVFACTLHEAALRMMGCVANELECLMEKEYGSDAYLREYLIRVRVQLSLEASADGNIDSEKALTICSNAVDKCLDSLRQLDENVIELGDRDSIMCGVLCSTLSSVSEFLATQTLPESFDPSSDEDRVGKKRRVINTNESAVCLLVANLMNVSELLLAIQLRAHADGTQLVAESRCIEGRIKVRMLLESLGHPFACSKTLTLRELNEWIRSSGSSLRRLQSSATGKSASSGNSVSSQSSPLTAWIETIELSRRMLTELLQLCLIEGCEQPTKKKAHTSNASTDRLDVNNTADLLKLLLEHADLLVTSEMGANTVKHTLDLLLSLRGFDFVEDSIKQLVLLKHFPGNGAFTRVHFMTELAKQSASNENSLGNSRFQKTVAWLLKQVDQRPSLFFDTNLTSFYEYILQYILFILHPSKDSSMNSRDTRTFAVTIAERAVAKYHDNRHLWQAFQDIERVCGHNDKAQHLLWRSKV